ncbi:hypothetical protein PtB15_6B13 [Puccinia triticina]|nr:hypothetical protein PtB15_6B13 [Puccinia triticina]
MLTYSLLSVSFGNSCATCTVVTKPRMALVTRNWASPLKMRTLMRGSGLQFPIRTRTMGKMLHPANGPPPKHVDLAKISVYPTNSRPPRGR